MTWTQLKSSNSFKIILGLIIYFSLLSVSFGNQTDDYNKGLRLFQQGELFDSEKLLINVKENFPHAKYLLGLIREKKGSYEDALVYFNEFIKNLDSTDDLYFAVKAHQAYCYSFLTDERNSKKLLDEIISKQIIDKNISFVTGAAALHLGEVTEKKEYADEAASAYQSILENVNSDDPEALNGFGRSYLLLFDISKHNKHPVNNYLTTALTSICHAIKIKPTSIYYNNLGAIYYKMGDWKTAEKYFTAALDSIVSDKIFLDKVQENLRHIKEMEKRYPLPKITPVICNLLNHLN